MPTKLLIPPMDGTPKQIVFADHAGDFSPTAANDLRVSTASHRLNVQMTFASVANDAARQSAKFDLADTAGKFATRYLMRAALEFAATPSAGELVRNYLAWSQSATAANANPGGLSGSDAAYTGYSSNLADSLKQLLGPYSGKVTGQATTTIQIITIGIVYPLGQHGILVFENKSNAGMHTDDVESHIVLDPLPDEFQNA